VRAPKSGDILTFFVPLFIVMNDIKKIMEIEHESLDYMSNFFDDFDFYNSDKDVCPVGNIRNDLIYYNPLSSLRTYYYQPINTSIITQFGDKKLVSELVSFVDYLKTIYNLKYLWLMVYSPQSKLKFHWDHGKDRHIISLNHNERFFNYENNIHLRHGVQNLCDLYNEKLEEKKDDINSFNEFFLNESEFSTIHVLDTKSVYTFGNSLHTFVNGSNKIRSALVFEIME
jgi:hypothetical protein